MMWFLLWLLSSLVSLVCVYCSEEYITRKDIALCALTGPLATLVIGAESLSARFEASKKWWEKRL